MSHIYIQYTITIIYTKFQIHIFNYHRNMLSRIYLKTKGGLFSKDVKCTFASLSNLSKFLIKLSIRCCSVLGRGRISRSGLTQDIKMGCCVWIAQRQVCPVSVYCDGGGGVVSCVCGMAFLCSSTLVKVPLLQAGTIVI